MDLSLVQGRGMAVKLNVTDRVTLLYNFLVVIFVITFRTKIGAYTYHLAFNLSVIFTILLLSLERRRKGLIHLLRYWYPLVLYTFLYYQTGLINRVIIPNFLDGFFLGLDVKIFGKFPGFILYGNGGNAFLDEFFHFFYFSYYLIIPVTGILLWRKDEKLFERFVFQVSLLFYLCYLIYIFLPVEGPISLRDEFYREGGLFRQLVDFIYKKGENPGAAFPSSHVAVTLLVAWWGSRFMGKWKVCYWSVFIFLSIATIFCMFHYAVDVIAGILLATLMLFLFNTMQRRAGL
jgi:membrane-associated phospholipid phosphatase